VAGSRRQLVTPIAANWRHELTCVMGVSEQTGPDLFRFILTILFHRCMGAAGGEFNV